MENSQHSAVIFTALSIEFNAVRSHLDDIHESVHDSGTVYEIGTFTSPTCIWRVGLVQIGMGNPRASFEVERAISFLRPSHVFFVGVAGGLKDVHLGDVVAATKVYAYEVGKADVEFKPRFDFGTSSYAMVQRAQAVARGGIWVQRIVSREMRNPSSNPQAFVGPIVSGEKIIASTQSSQYALLRQQCSDALAVEMEAFGFLLAVHANHQVKALVVRGISDLIDSKAEADASGSQDRASQHAAAFAFEVLYNIDNTSTSVNSSRGIDLNLDDTQWKQLVLIAAQLYPQGPNDQNIWPRAGGNLAMLDLSGSGRSAWYKALNMLRNGGGGQEITISRLIQFMQEDYPNNPTLQSFGKRT